MQLKRFEKAIFLDRDGIINHDPGDYTKSVNEFTILPSILDTLEIWASEGYGLIVITNQAGITKGLYNSDAVDAMHQYLQGACIARGFSIAHFFYCPHHPEFSGLCLCRKPGSLMVEKGLHMFKLNPKNCVLIGDKPRDIEAGEKAGVRGVLQATNAPIYPDMINLRIK